MAHTMVYHSMACILGRAMPPARSVRHDAIRFRAIIRRVRGERGWTRLKLARRSGMQVNVASLCGGGACRSSR